MTIPSKFRLPLAGALLASFISCSDYPEIPYLERITSSSSGISSSLGISSSSDISSSSEGNTFTDKRDNMTYGYAKIGEQVWMVQNMNFATPGSKCYDSQDDNCRIYGRLYTLAATENACPPDWHLPSKVEWDAMITAVANSLVEIFDVRYGGFGIGTEFSLLGDASFWWSSDGYYYSIFSNNAIESDTDSPDALNSVRCVRDSK